MACRQLTGIKQITHMCLSPAEQGAELCLAGELARRWNQILPSFLATFEKLKNLGFTYYNGNVSVILPEKEVK